MRAEENEALQQKVFQLEDKMANCKVTLAGHMEARDDAEFRFESLAIQHKQAIAELDELRKRRKGFLLAGFS